MNMQNNTLGLLPQAERARLKLYENVPKKSTSRASRRTALPRKRIVPEMDAVEQERSVAADKL